jgi:hypothetical protein
MEIENQQLKMSNLKQAEQIMMLEDKLQGDPDPPSTTGTLVHLPSTSPSESTKLHFNNQPAVVTALTSVITVFNCYPPKVMQMVWLKWHRICTSGRM